VWRETVEFLLGLGRELGAWRLRNDLPELLFRDCVHAGFRQALRVGKLCLEAVRLIIVRLSWSAARLGVS